jgi:hypothetical protein
MKTVIGWELKIQNFGVKSKNGNMDGELITAISKRFN